MDELGQLIGTLIAEQGFPTAILIVAILFFYYKIWPHYVSIQIEQRKLTDEYRQNTLNEIKELKEDARRDKQLMYDAFIRNVESNLKLNETLEDITHQIVDIRREVTEVRADVRNVYVIVGKNRRLIDPTTERQQK